MYEILLTFGHAPDRSLDVISFFGVLELLYLLSYLQMAKRWVYGYLFYGSKDRNCVIFHYGSMIIHPP